MSDDDYEVGYGKPPKATRFKKGRSGNPKGRPTGVKNLATALEQALAEPISVTVGGSRRRRMAKGEAIVTQLVNKALGGDVRALALLLNQVGTKNADPERQPSSTSLGETTEDQQVIASLLARMNPRDDEGGAQ